MKILYIGGGFVGICSAAVSADSGHETLVYDIDEKKIKAFSSFEKDEIDKYVFEKGLAEMMVENRERLKFTTDYGIVRSFLDEVEVIFMCLPTPEKDGGRGETNLDYFNVAAKILAENLVLRNGGKQKNYVVVVNKSTVPISMADDTTKILCDGGVSNFGVVSNPEFLVEGKALEGSVNPDRIVIGAGQEKDFAIMRRTYQRFVDSVGVEYLEVSSREAAAAKLLANYLLFNKVVTTYDVVGRVCESFPDLSFENVRRVLISEPRIGGWGFYDSLYAGGSCFTKDALSLAHQMESVGARAVQVRVTLESNEFQRDHFFSRAETEAKFQWKGKVVAVLGLAFKQDTNDVRHSPALDIVRHLENAGVKKINLFDPAARVYFEEAYGKSRVLNYVENTENALEGTDACLVLTDWPQFKTLAKNILAVAKKGYLVMDGRRLLVQDFDRLVRAGCDIIAVGSPFLGGKK